MVTVKRVKKLKKPFIMKAFIEKKKQFLSLKMENLRK